MTEDQNPDSIYLDIALRGHPVNAIMRYSRERGVNLKKAKAAVEKMIEDHFAKQEIK